VLEQETNAYAVLPDTQWRGYRPPQEPPAPAPGTWGDIPPTAHAVCARPGSAGGAGRERSAVGGSDPRRRPQGQTGSGVGEARAGVPDARLVSSIGVHGVQRNPPQTQFARHRMG
jgi:hypothetical protein